MPLNELNNANYEDLIQFNIDLNHLNHHIHSSYESVKFEKPTKIDHYSSDLCKQTRKRILKFNDTNLSYLHLQFDELKLHKLYDVNYDILDNYEQMKHIIWSNPSLDKLDEILEWILKNRKTLINDDNKIRYDFITQRGVLTKLLCTPFTNDEWYLGLSRFQNTIYICPFFNDQIENEQNDGNFEQSNKASYGGYRFEHFVTKSIHDDDDDSQSNDFTSILHEYAGIFETKINSLIDNYSLLYVAEIDCLKQKNLDAKRMENFFEIKTMKSIDNHMQLKNFHRYRSIRWWAQCKLVDINEIICGYKNEQLTNVISIERMSVDKLESDSIRYWNARKCWNFLHYFLKYSRNLLKNEDNHRVVYLFSKERNSRIITCKKLLNLNHNNYLQIIPDWYVNAFKQRENKSKESKKSSQE